MPFGVRSTLDEKDRAANCDTQSIGDVFVGRYSLHLVFGLDQGRVVLAFEQGKDRLGLQVVLSDLLSDFQRQIRLIKRYCHAIGEPDALNPIDLSARGDSKVLSG